MLKTFMIACSAFFLTACGFHLQGEIPLAKPLHSMYLQSNDPYGHLARDLRQYLKMSNVQLASSSSAAETSLIILEDEPSESLLSVSGTQITRQYLLKVTVVFEIIDKNGQTIVPPQTLAETRTITVQSSQILGSSNEANLYYQQMRSQLAYAVMSRIGSTEVTNLVNQAFASKTQKKQ